MKIPLQPPGKLLRWILDKLWIIYKISSIYILVFQFTYILAHALRITYL